MKLDLAYEHVNKRAINIIHESYDFIFKLLLTILMMEVN